MGFLLLSICCNTAIVVIFRLINNWKVDTLETIVINYGIAFLAGFILNLSSFGTLHIPSAGWVWTALAIGILFVLMFYVLGLTVAKVGISISTIAAKMSVIIPILFSILVFGESLNIIKIAGIFLALISLVMVLYPDKKLPDHRNLFFPILLFVGMGLVDSSVKFAQQVYVGSDDLLSFSTILFLISFLASLIWRLSRTSKKFVLQKKLLLAGTLLGMANLGSLYFLISALESGFRDSSMIFGMNNIGIVTLSVCTGLLFFRERLSRISGTGMILALVSLYLLFRA